MSSCGTWGASSPMRKISDAENFLQSQKAVEFDVIDDLPDRDVILGDFDSEGMELVDVGAHHIDKHRAVLVEQPSDIVVGDLHLGDI